MNKFEHYINIIQEMKVLYGEKDKQKYKPIDFIIDDILRKIKTDNENKYLLILVGIAASGKSTFIKAIKEKFNKKEIGVLERDRMVILNAKIINREIKKRNMSNEKITYDKSFNLTGNNKKQVDKNIDDLFDRKIKLSKDKRMIIIDRTNLTRKSRVDFINKFKDRKIITVDFYRALHDIEYEKKVNAFEKNAQIRKDKQKDEVKKKTIDRNVIERMLKQYEIPAKNEGIDFIYNINYEDIKKIIKL